jgi:photosystem II stability/assembly factor-like uncharacterized protein
MKITNELKLGLKELFNNTPDDILVTGFGRKRVNGLNTNEFCIVFGVEKKLSINELKDKYIVPKTIEIDGIIYKTDVVELPNINHLACFNWLTPPLDRKIVEHRSRQRPLKGGISISPDGSSYGTLGLICVDNETNSLVGLTNVHVAVKIPEGLIPESVTSLNSDSYNIINKKIYQYTETAPFNTITDNIGVINKYYPLKLPPYDNYIDVATISLRKCAPNGVPFTLNSESFKQLNINYDKPMAFATSEEIDNLVINNISLYSAGRTTGAKGTVDCKLNPYLTSAYSVVSFGGIFIDFYDLVFFENADESPYPIAPGDSGSIIIGDFDGIFKIVGIVFAASLYDGVFCRIDHVAEKLNISAWDGSPKYFLENNPEIDIESFNFISQNTSDENALNWNLTNNEYWFGGFIKGSDYNVDPPFIIDDIELPNEKFLLPCHPFRDSSSSSSSSSISPPLTFSNVDGKYQLLLDNGTLNGNVNYGIGRWGNTSLQGVGAVAAAASSSFNIVAVLSSGGKVYISYSWGSLYELVDPFFGSFVYATSIAMSSDGRYITAIASNSISISDDFGQTWTNRPNLFPLNSTLIKISMSYSGQYQSIVSVGIATCIYRSADFGNTWVATLILPIEWIDIAISSDGRIQTAIASGPSRSSELGGALYVSRDFGETWRKITIAGTNGLTGEANYQSICMNYNGQFQFLTGISYVFMSSNFGETWTLLTPFGRNTPRIFGLNRSAMSASGKYITVASYFGPVYISSNYGSTWSEIPSLNFNRPTWWGPAGWMFVYINREDPSVLPPSSSSSSSQSSSSSSSSVSNGIGDGRYIAFIGKDSLAQTNTPPLNGVIRNGLLYSDNFGVSYNLLTNLSYDNNQIGGGWNAVGVSADGKVITIINSNNDVWRSVDSGTIFNYDINLQGSKPKVIMTKDGSSQLVLTSYELRGCSNCNSPGQRGWFRIDSARFRPRPEFFALFIDADMNIDPNRGKHIIITRSDITYEPNFFTPYRRREIIGRAYVGFTNNYDQLSFTSPSDEIEDFTYFWYNYTINFNLRIAAAGNGFFFNQGGFGFIEFDCRYIKYNNIRDFSSCSITTTSAGDYIVLTTRDFIQDIVISETRFGAGPIGSPDTTTSSFGTYPAITHRAQVFIKTPTDNLFRGVFPIVLNLDPYDSINQRPPVTNWLYSAISEDGRFITAVGTKTNAFYSFAPGGGFVIYFSTDFGTNWRIGYESFAIEESPISFKMSSDGSLQMLAVSNRIQEKITFIMYARNSGTWFSTDRNPITNLIDFDIS